MATRHQHYRNKGSGGICPCTGAPASPDLAHRVRIHSRPQPPRDVVVDLPVGTTEEATRWPLHHEGPRQPAGEAVMAKGGEVIFMPPCVFCLDNHACDIIMCMGASARDNDFTARG